MKSRSKFFNPRSDGKVVLNRTYWNAWYKAERAKLEDKGRSAWGAPTQVMLDEIRKAGGELRGKRVIDFGAGDGRYSVHFAKQQGACVDHVDCAAGAIEGLIQHAHRSPGGAIVLGPRDDIFINFVPGDGDINVFQMSIRTYNGSPASKLHHGTDLVISSGIMEYLTPGEVERAIKLWQIGTTVGGVHAIVYLAQGPGVSEIPGEHPHEPGFVERLYPRRKWRFTFEGDTTREDTHIIIRPGDTVITPERPAETHTHRIMRFVAQKLDD